MDSGFLLKAAPFFLQAAKLTAVIAFWGILLAAVCGLICAAARFYRVPLLSQLAAGYIELARNTPLIVQLFFLYFGLPRAGIRLDGQTCAIAGLTFLGGAYLAEAFRGGLAAVGRGQIEGGLSIGLNRLQLLRYVIIPQALAVSLPAISATVIFLMKETSVFSIVALPDLMYVAKDLLKEGHSAETNVLLVASYLVLILPVSLLLGWAERRLRFAGFGA
ncbi:MAG: amino acid ABC transporter permease [Deltaproteobacteria bacterium]|nr:amino acid ABC transporter permease [Deltaproteobacteria bacterium]